MRFSHCGQQNRYLRKSMDQELYIDKEFQTLIRPLSKKEYKQLEANLLADGCLDPIIVWGRIIIDGHHRYAICRKHNLHFEIKEKDFDSREEAIVWICAHQLGRRNLSEEAMKFLIGVQYEKEKVVAKRRNEAGTNQYTSTKQRKESSQRPMIATTTAQRIAEEQHLSPSTVVKYGQYASALHSISEKEPTLLPKILSGRYKISHQSILNLSKMPKEDVKEVNRSIENNEASFVKYKHTRKEINEQLNSKEQLVLPGTTVKTKPQYDPDAEVTGLMLTVPSWIGSMERVRTKVDLSDVTDITKDKLCRTLHLLMIEAAKTMKEVRS